MSEAERLAERLRELLAKATPGPWEVYKHLIAKIEDALEELAYQVVHTDPLADHLFLLNASGKCPATTGCGPTSEANAALIVEAVNALPTLLARIAALEDALLAIESMETNWALGIDGGMESARRAARKALGKGSE